MIDRLKEGMRVDIEIQLSTGKIYLISKLVEVLEDNIICIDEPFSKGMPYRLRSEEEYKLIIRAGKEGAYTIKGKAVKRLREGENVVLYHIVPTTQLEKIQMRGFYRIEVTGDATLLVEDEKEKKEIQCIIKDISGGGIRVLCNDSVKQETLLLCLLQLDGHKIILEGQVVRGNYSNDILKHDLSISFRNVIPANEKIIMKYIYDTQRKLIKRGLMV